MEDERETNKYNYNDGVIVKQDAPLSFLSGKDGVICGMNKITTKQGAEEYACRIGDWVYIVEFSDGSSMEIAECHLDTDPDRLRYCLRERVIMEKDIPDKYFPTKVVSILGYHDVAEELVAKEFNLKIGDVIYVLKTERGEQFLSLESFIYKKAST